MLAALMLLQAGLPPAPQWRADAPIPPPSSMEKGSAATPDATPSGNRLVRAPDGHFYATALVNGIGVRFIVDTGASTVMLTPLDAARVGLTLAPADFRLQARTASGIADVAPVTLATVAVGSRQVSGVPGVVTRVDSGMSLLGMTFLRHMKRVTIENDVMHLE